MKVNLEEFSHLTKVDPAKSLPSNLDVLTKTDAIIVGGSDNVTAANTRDTIKHIRKAAPSIPMLQEPYHQHQISSDTLDAIDGVAVPAVYNGDRAHFRDKHLAFFSALSAVPGDARVSQIPVLGSLIEARGRDRIKALTDRIIGEGYVIQHPDSRAATVTGATTPCSTEQVIGAAIATETFYRFPIFYIEYSGMYGGPDDVAAAAPHLEDTLLVYGGGIRNGQQSAEILAAGADAIVVGDCFHNDLDRYLETIP